MTDENEKPEGGDAAKTADLLEFVLAGRPDRVVDAFLAASPAEVRAAMGAMTTDIAALALGAGTGVAIVSGVVTFVVVLVLPAIWAYRSFGASERKFTTMFPAEKDPGERP